MAEQGAIRQIARWVALGALFLIPITPLLVADGSIIPNFFFPFITAKAFFFRIMVEIAVASWLVLATVDREYRPRFSAISWALLAFIIWMAVADSFAVNAHKAFWSNFERMEGWVLLVHLYGFFLAASAVLRVERKWRAWFLTSLGVAVVVSGYGLLQQAGRLAIHQGSTRIDATFGNSAYLAIYLLFNIFLALWLALTSRQAWLKWVLIAFALLEAVLIFLTETRGTVLGLLGGLGLAALLTAFTAGRRVRAWALGGLVALVLVAGGVWLARGTSLVEGNHVLQRITSISLSAGQVRFEIWGMAWQGFLARPVTGWGQEGFNYVFDHYYNPKLYGQEPWFDRAHNAFIDWLIAGGAPGFVLFVLLFATGLWLLWSRSELSRAERILFTAALAGYAVHDLFVFDNLYSYVYFFAILALIDSQVGRRLGFFERLPVLDATSAAVYAAPLALLAGGLAIWFVNVPGLSVASELITAISPSSGGYTGNIAAFTDLAAHPAFAAQEVREQLVSFAATAAADPSATTEERQQIVTLAVNGMKAQTAAYPLDTREWLELAYAYRAGGDTADALVAGKQAVTLSPTKEDAWISLGALEWDANDTKAAEIDFDQAYALAPEYSSLAPYAAAGAYAAGETAKGDAILESAFGTTTVDNDVLAAAYYHAHDWPPLIRLFTLRATPAAGAQGLFSLAAVYYAAGDNASAIATLRNAAATYPDAASEVQSTIQQIQTGTLPRQ